MVTVEELSRDAVGSIDIDLTDKSAKIALGDSYREMAEVAIKDAVSSIESYLDKTIRLTKNTIYILSDDWHYNESRGKYEYIPDNIPIVQVLTDGVTFDNPYLLSDSPEKKVEYYSGYRRSDQTLEALQDEFKDLTVLPDIVPGVIRRVCVKLAIYEIVIAYDRLIGYASSEKNIAGVQTVVSKDSTEYQRELDRLESWRRLQ